MRTVKRIDSERGIALVTVLLVALVVAVISAGAALVSSNTTLINAYAKRQSVLDVAADAGLEEARSMINGNAALYPESLYAALESGAAVKDASGTVIPGVQRSLYVGPTGITSGQYGVFGSVVSVVEDQAGNKVIRRGEVVQESFAKYAYFTDVEPSSIAFGGGDAIFGPVHSNDYLKIYSSGASFYGQVTTAKTIQGKQYGTFAQGYTENGPYIGMPKTADLLKLKKQAQAGGTAFVGSLGSGNAGEATLRIEFVAVDINGDGRRDGANEGFIRVYQSADPTWVVAARPGTYGSRGLRDSRNCGHMTGFNHPNFFMSANDHNNSDPNGDHNSAAVTTNNFRCFLGGNDTLNADAANPTGVFNPNDGRGQFLPWPGAVDPLVSNARAAVGDAAYLFPINRQFNPNFKGVIYVDGKVALSGRLRGQVTVAATGNIILADDITYVTDPSSGTCQDIMGIFAGVDVVVADNSLNAPSRSTSGSAGYRTYDDTSDEFFHSVVLALRYFWVENFWLGSSGAEDCGPTNWGRGCLFLTGGIIQRERGPVGLNSGYGYLKRYSYDQCAFSNPPPYFPTTGHFARGHYYEVDPVGFDVAQYYKMLTPPS